MGNVASCAPSIISSNGVVKVLFSNGELGLYTTPVTAAELMLENPGKFVCDSCCLKVGHRIAGISADEELLPKQLYYLLPIEMLYSVLTIEEMSCLHDKASKASKHGGGGGLMNFSRIFPIFGEFCLLPNAEAMTMESTALTDDDDDDDDDDHQQMSKSYSRHRSWKPALETIIETLTPPRV